MIGVVGGGSIVAGVYLGKLVVPTLGFSELMPLHAVPMKQPSHSVLLGRNFLKNFILTFDGPRGVFHFFKPGSTTDHILDDFAT